MLIVAAIILLLPLVFASVDDEIKKLTYYAEEYETGNINYVQLITYTSSIRENLNEILGAESKQDGGILKQEQIKKVLGEPSGYTDWIWVEGENREKRVDEEVPYWEKIVFDGKKIQIRLNSYPSIFKKKSFEGESKGDDENNDKLIYRLNFYTEFKKPKDAINIQEKIDDIKGLAEVFNSDPSTENAEKLAKESVSAEKSFESYFKQSGQNCEDVMNGIFGSENKREDQKLIVNEMDFYEGENFDAKARLEFCDDCLNHYTNLDLWLDMRGKMDVKEENSKNEEIIQEPITFEEFKAQTQTILESMKSSLAGKDFGGFFKLQRDLRAANNAWNMASKDVWKQLDEEYKAKSDSIGKDNPDPYWWVALEKEKREKVKQIEDGNYQKTKEFYSQLFSGYDKKEFFFQQIQWEKRLLEDFKESGEEICDNNKDDNQNGQIDCQEDSCGGKICGWSEVEIEVAESTQVSNQLEVVNSVEVEIKNETVQLTHETTEVLETKTEENSENTSVSDIVTITGGVIEATEAESNVTQAETQEAEVEKPVEAQATTKKTAPLYCISQECKPKEESFKATRTICGNHICESGENCAEDCSTCPQYPAVSCSGKVIFSGEDEKGCPLEPVCIEEKVCEKNEDCSQPLCGKAECIIENGIGICKTSMFEECKEAECVEGEEKAQVCENKEKRIIQICQEGKWIETGVSECEAIKEETEEEELVGSQCNTKEDCGNADDVCSNGKCVTIPYTKEAQEEQEAQQEEAIKEETAAGEEQPKPQETQEPPSQSDDQLTAAVITGNQVEEPVPPQEPIMQEPPVQQETTTPDNQSVNEQPVNEPVPNQPYQENAPQPVQDNNQMQQFNPEEDRERRIQNCKENSERECTNRYVMDCVGKCVFKDNQEQDLEQCKKSCAEENKQQINDCISRCSTTCEKEDWCQIDWPSGENKQEQGVFMVGGMCRTSQQKTESFIFFNGWGESFDRIQNLKNKYYEGGESDWCKWELENLIRERREIEKSLNQEYAVWFFEKYLSNSAEDWEQHVSGIYELYWKIIENQKQIAERMKCSGEQEPPEFNLINISYHTEYGSLELWEELKTARMDEKNEVQVASPYMKLWILPPKEFIKYEMKKAMESGEFPGSPEEKLERKNQEGLTQEEKEKIKTDAKFMKKISKISEKYGGSYDGVVQIKDYATGEIVFNLLVKVNEEDIMIAKPMLPEQVPEKDVSITLDFDKVYELVSTGEDMKKEEIQAPPWDKQKINPGKQIKNAVNGIKMYFKVRDLINSAEYEPKESKKEVKSLINSFMLMMMKEGEGGGESGQDTEQLTDEEKAQAEEIKNELLDPKEALTGEIILG